MHYVSRGYTTPGPYLHTPATRALLVERIHHWRHELGLFDWWLVSVDFSARKSPADSDMSVSYNCDQHNYRVHCCDEWNVPITRENLDAHVVHELLHIVLADLYEFGDEICAPGRKDDLGRIEHTVIQRLVRVISAADTTITSDGPVENIAQVADAVRIETPVPAAPQQAATPEGDTGPANVVTDGGQAIIQKTIEKLARPPEDWVAKYGLDAVPFDPALVRTGQPQGDLARDDFDAATRLYFGGRSGGKPAVSKEAARLWCADALPVGKIHDPLATRAAVQDRGVNHVAARWYYEALQAVEYLNGFTREGQVVEAFCAGYLTGWHERVATTGQISDVNRASMEFRVGDTDECAFAVTNRQAILTFEDFQRGVGLMFGGKAVGSFNLTETVAMIGWIARNGYAARE